MTTMLFYKSVKALNRVAHQDFRLNTKPNPFLFAKLTNSVLLSASEFVDAGRDYPIVFVGEENGPFAAAALVGLRDNENLFVSEDGSWAEATYIPAFVRRYPFVLAEDGAQLTVCIDENYSELNTKEGEALFTGNGEESAFLKDVLNFLQAFHVDMQRTKLFTDKLVELGLLVQKTITVQQEKAQQSLNGIWVIDEEKLAVLSDEPLLELQRSGYMAAIHAHLFSLRNVNRLAARIDLNDNKQNPPEKIKPSTASRKKSEAETV